jgi:hypothetical protein
MARGGGPARFVGSTDGSEPPAPAIIPAAVLAGVQATAAGMSPARRPRHRCPTVGSPSCCYLCAGEPIRDEGRSDHRGGSHHWCNHALPGQSIPRGSASRPSTPKAVSPCWRRRPYVVQIHTTVPGLGSGSPGVGGSGPKTGLTEERRRASDWTWRERARGRGEMVQQDKESPHVWWKSVPPRRKL